MGADVVGGLPWFELLDEEARTHIDFCFELAKKHDKDIHMLVDDTDNPLSRSLEYLAAKEQYERQRSWRSFQHLMERLLQLQSTNAIIQSLMQERLLEQMTAGAAPDDSADVVSKTRGAA